MISHWDDVPWKIHEHGELRCERQHLSRPRGSAGATLSRYRIAPGARSMPQHVHVDEEELFFVLAGSGLSRQADAVHEVRAGDLVAHLADHEPHTLLASPDEPLELLAYAGGSPTGLTHLPRAGVSWVGSRWIPQDAPHPFEAEPPAGELPAPTPRPPTIVALDDIEPRMQDRGLVRCTRLDLGSIVARPAGTGVARLRGRRRGSRPAGLRHARASRHVLECGLAEDRLPRPARDRRRRAAGLLGRRGMTPTSLA